MALNLKDVLKYDDQGSDHVDGGGGYKRNQNLITQRFVVNHIAKTLTEQEHKNQNDPRAY